MPSVTAVVVGAGQSGLAMSHCLTERGIDHVVLERGDVAQSWRTERWDSLRLLTPNWYSRLPGYRYQGDDPDGFMTTGEVAAYIGGFARQFGAPVVPHAEVTALSAEGGGFRVTSTAGEWHARAVVVASGPYSRPELPPFAGLLPESVESVAAVDYRNPDGLAEGGVLVVGAAATGIQLAQEIHRSGRRVTLAVGEHVRMPRTYRGRDAFWWLDATGTLDQRYEEADDLVRARNVSSFQLVGTIDRATLDLNLLQDEGVELVGRLAGITADGVAQFSGSLANKCSLADLKLDRLLNSFDEWAVTTGAEVGSPERRPEPVRVSTSPRLMLSLASGRIKTVVWATGLRPDYPWLDIPVLDAKGRVIHDGGVTSVPGLYLIGGMFLRRRKSSFIDGAADDARELSEHLAAYLGRDAAAG